MAEEENIKIKFLELEKRFVELEMVVSQLKDQLKGFEQKKIEEFLNRLDELEDQVLIETAALDELRNLLEASDTSELHKKIEGLRNELENKFNEVFNKLSSVSEEVKSHLNEIKEIKKKVEEEISKKIPESFINDFVRLDNEVRFLTAKLLSVSKDIEQISSEIRLVKPEVVKEFLSKVMEIKNEIEGKFQELNTLISSMTASREKIEEIPIIKNNISELNRRIGEMAANVESVSAQMNMYPSKKELEDLKSIVNSINQEINDLKLKIGTMEKIEKTVSNLENSTLKLDERINSVIEEINSLKLKIENKKELEKIEKMIAEVNSLWQKISKQDEDISKVKDSLKSVKDEIEKKFVRVDEFSNFVIDLKKISMEVEKLKKDELSFLTKDEMKSVKDEIFELKKIAQELKSHSIPKELIQNLANKLNFLEAKIKEFEERKSKIQPIILE